MQPGSKQDVAFPLTRHHRDERFLVGRMRFTTQAGSFLVLLVVWQIVAMLSPVSVSPPAAQPQRDLAVPDLLLWVPATDETRLAFAMWLASDASSPAELIPGSTPIVRRLALLPMPRTLGRSPGWRERFGYGARDVLSWVAAGPNAELAVLSGTFDQAAIEHALLASGYHTRQHRGVTIFVHDGPARPAPVIEGDSVTAAQAVAVFPGLLLTSSRPELVEDAIGASQGVIPSLATNQSIVTISRTLAPYHGLMIRDATLHARECGLASPGAEPFRPSGRYVAIAYGDNGSSATRRTFIANAFVSPDEATAIQSPYISAWFSELPLVEGSPLAAFGRLTTVAQTGPVLVAEIVDGRDDGWARSGIRFAYPVCAAAAASPPSGTPPA